MTDGVANSRSFEEISTGDEEAFEVTVTADMVADFASLTGDFSPLHTDEEYARQTYFRRRVVHGMLVAAHFSTIVGMYLPGRQALYISQDLRFPQPLFVGDTVRVSGRVVHKSESTRTFALEMRAVRTDGGVVAEGLARVLYRDTVTAHAWTPEPGAQAMDLSGQVALITGASRGIGRAVALLVASRGARVVVNCRASTAEAEAVVGEVRGAGGEARLGQADVRDAEAIRSLVDETVQEWGPVTILVNNASGALSGQPFEKTSWADYADHLDVILGGALATSQACVPGMREVGRGRIVNVLTTAVDAPPPKLAPYVVAKSALAGLTRCMAVELGPAGITVNAVSPGMIDTSLTSHLPSQIKQMEAVQVPLRRIGTPSDVAQAVGFLVSDAAGYLSGVNLQVAGGRVLF